MSRSWWKPLSDPSPVQAPAGPPGPPRQLGGYRLLERIAGGGMGEVWRAEHVGLARPVAVKLIRSERFRADRVAESIARFEREAKATAALRSPHTVAIYDFGSADDGTIYYVMELLEGFDAQTLVERWGPLPPARAVHLLRQACHSLAEAHLAGLVHRDIKPANIFVCRYGQELDFVKVLDFGLVKTTTVVWPEEAKLTGQGFIPGTPEYISPETARGDAEVDWRSDIYALGCVAYYLLTGTHLFQESSAVRVALHHVETAPVPPSVRSGLPIPRELEQIVLDCLAKHPRLRPQTAGELSDRLAALGLEEQWTRRDAEVWWRDHEAGPSEDSTPTIEAGIVPRSNGWSALRRMFGRP